MPSAALITSGVTRVVTKDRVLCYACWVAAILVVALFSALVWDILLRAGEINWQFFVAEPEDAGRSGGIGPILLSTALIVIVCGLVAVPLALATAVFICLYARREGRLVTAVRIGLDVLASTPSIVFGLFGSAFFCLFLGLGFSILSGGLTLACMVLPGIVRMTEEGISSVPEEYYLSGAALGLSKSSLFFQVLLPVAAPAIAAAFVLGIARALSETAALLFTSGYVLRAPESLLDSGRSLSVHIYDLAMNVTGGEANAYRSAAVLLLLLLVINFTAVTLMNYWLQRVARR